MDEETGEDRGRALPPRELGKLVVDKRSLLVVHRRMVEKPIYCY